MRENGWANWQNDKQKKCFYSFYGDVKQQLMSVVMSDQYHRIKTRRISQASKSCAYVYVQRNWLNDDDAADDYKFYFFFSIAKLDSRSVVASTATTTAATAFMPLLINISLAFMQIAIFDAGINCIHLVVAVRLRCCWCWCIQSASTKHSLSECSIFICHIIGRNWASLVKLKRMQSMLSTSRNTLTQIEEDEWEWERSFSMSSDDSSQNL